MNFTKTPSFDPKTSELLGSRIIATPDKIIHLSEHLYFNKDSNCYFLYGKGGNYSSYSNFKNGKFTSGESVRIIPKRRAEIWLKENLK